MTFAGGNMTCPYGSNPWAVAAPYAWGWVGSPWAVYYGAWFTPYPVYGSASLWLMDYTFSASLAAAYQQQLAAGALPPTPGPAAGLTPEVKQLVAAEVQRQVALEYNEQSQAARNIQPDPGSSGIARMLTDNISHVFVAGTDLDVIDAGGQECGLSPGDIVQLLAPPPLGAAAASVVVLASKTQECRKGSTVSIALADLQDMQNHLRETIDQGLGEVQSHPGGLPALPESAQAAPVVAPFAAIAPPPDPNAAAEINGQVRQADALEQEAAGSGENFYSAQPAPIAPPVAAPAGNPPTLTRGLTVDQVVAIMGQQKTYIYGEMKVVFANGRVTDIQ